MPEEFVVEIGTMRVSLHRRTVFDVRTFRQFVLYSTVVLPQMAAEYGSTEDIIAAVYSDYAQVSAMVHQAQGLPFEYLSARDSQAQVLAKFRVYVEQAVAVQSFVDKVNLKALEIMQPANPSTAPGVVSEKKASGKPTPSSSSASAPTPAGKSRRPSRKAGASGMTNSTSVSSVP